MRSGHPAVVCLGEVLIDFVARDADLPLQQATMFHKAAGGRTNGVFAGPA